MFINLDFKKQKKEAAGLNPVTLFIAHEIEFNMLGYNLIKEVEDSLTFNLLCEVTFDLYLRGFDFIEILSEYIVDGFHEKIYSVYELKNNPKVVTDYVKSRQESEEE